MLSILFGASLISVLVGTLTAATITTTVLKGAATTIKIAWR